MPDILIIGQGLAGTATAWEAQRRGLSVRIADPHETQGASWVASGLYNPLVLKRRTLVWHAHAMMEMLLPHYQFALSHLPGEYLHPLPIVHRIHDAGEENAWTGLLADDRFAPFLKDVSPNLTPFVSGAGVLATQQTGWLNVPPYLADSRAYFESSGCFIKADVSPEDIHPSGSNYRWKEWEFKHILWANGIANHRLKALFRPTKGEVLTVSIPGLNETRILHGSIFLIPLGNNTYRLGATYAPLGEGSLLTEEGKNHLLQQAEELIGLKPVVLEHQAGIRANTKDRRPLGGRDENGHWHVNGLGSRGVLISPWLAARVLDETQGIHTLPPEANLQRFT